MSQRGATSIGVISLKRMGRSQTRVVAMVAPLALLLAACSSTPSAAPAKSSTTSTSIHKTAKVAPVAKVKAHHATTTVASSSTTQPKGSSGDTSPTPSYSPPTTAYVPPATTPPTSPPPTTRCSDLNSPPSGCSVTSASFTSCSVGVPNPTATVSYNYSDGSNFTITYNVSGIGWEIKTDPHGWPLPATLVVVNDPANPSTDRCGLL